MLFLCVWVNFSGEAKATSRWGTPDLGRKLEEGHWNERIYAVNELGRRGQSAFPELKQALKDPDWQVRLTAVHWLSSLGAPAVPALESMLSVERCAVVRIAGMHQLGRMGGERSPRKMTDKEKTSECRSWTWPLTPEYIHARRKKSRRTEASLLDEKGCQYIQYKRSGQKICPEGFLLQGVGSAPGHVDILRKGRPPVSGVALCCKAADEETSALIEPPKPQDVECRLHPMECPSPWVEMAPPDNLGWSRKERAFRRSSKMRRGAMTWVHCCRPHTTEVQEYFPPAKESFVRAIPERVPTGEAPSEFLSDYVLEEEEDAYEDFGSMPEEEIARQALTRKSLPPPEAQSEEMPTSDYVDLEVRKKAFDALLGKLDHAESRPQKRLAAPEGIAVPRGKKGEADIRREEIDRTPAAGALDAPRKYWGEPDGGLEAARGLPPRIEAAARAPADIEADAGKIVHHNPLPELLKSLRHPIAQRRSRAADEIGSLGEKGQGAVRALTRALKDKSPRVRSSAALALGNITAGNNAALKELQAMLKDDHVDVRYSAAMALGRVGTPEARTVFGRHMRAETRRVMRILDR